MDIIREFDGSLAVARIEEGGLMEQWNDTFPDKAVQPGDRFAEARLLLGKYGKGEHGITRRVDTQADTYNIIIMI